MADESSDQALRAMAEHRGLKLVKSRRRKPGTGDFGKYGLTDAAGTPLLGMGADGHTASFFPNGDNLVAALNPQNPRAVSVIRAEGAGEPRVTLTLPRLVEARFLALHIEGTEKARVLSSAQQAGSELDLPIRAVLRAPREHPLQIFWAPLPQDEA